MDRIMQVITDTFRVKAEVLTPEKKMEDIDAWDSLTHMELIANLEDEFGFEFTNEEIMKMTSIGMILKTVEEKLAQ